MRHVSNLAVRYLNPVLRPGYQKPTDSHSSFEFGGAPGLPGTIDHIILTFGDKLNCFTFRYFTQANSEIGEFSSWLDLATSTY